MMKKLLVSNHMLSLIFLVLTMTNNLSYANDKTLSISLPPFPPFDSFSPDTTCTGVGVIAIQEVTKNLKVKLALASYPYARIMHSLKTGELDLALIFKNNIIANDVEYIGPLSLSKVLVLTKNNITIKHYNELYKLNSIGVIRSAHFNEKFDQDNLLNKVSVNSYSQAIRLLKLDRISSVVGSRIGLEYALRQQNMDEALITNAFKLGYKEWGLHLSKKSPFMAELALLRTAVKSSYKKDLIYRLYQRQISHCSLAKS